MPGNPTFVCGELSFNGMIGGEKERVRECEGE